MHGRARPLGLTICAFLNILRLGRRQSMQSEKPHTRIRISSEWLRDYVREHGGVMTVTSGLVVE